MAGSDHQYTVVARRYRPQLFSDLVGQDHIARALSNAIGQNRVGHAYLFTGARGVGKTSSARIFAKCLNCAEGMSASPCVNEAEDPHDPATDTRCDICQAISSGEDVDVLEIDGASNRGIDEIRQLRSNAGVRPGRARFKIYIIDEVHMLTSQAFNALLKTLEEPPGHVKFIFCTTDPQKIPITVLSRCQRFDFSPVQSNDICDRLAEIAENENIKADREALALLARRAGGSMRDSQSLLEQLFSFCGDDITVDEVNQLLGTADMSRIAGIVATMTANDTAAALGLVNSAAAEGVDAGQLGSQMLGFYRDMMAAHVGCGEDTLLNCSAADIDSLRDAGAKLGLETILSSIQILDSAVMRMQSSVHTRTLLEVAVVRICNLQKLESISALVEALSGLNGTVSTARKAPTKAPAKKNGIADRRTTGATADEGAVSSASGGHASVPASKSRSFSGSPVGQTATAVAGAAVGAAAATAGAVSSSVSATVDSNLNAHQPPVTPQVAETGSEYHEKPASDPAAAADSKTSPEEKQSEEISPADSSRADSSPAESVQAGDPGQVDQKNIADLWRRALEGIEGMTADIAADYESLEVPRTGKLVVTLTNSYNRDMCGRADRKNKLQDALSSVAGQPMEIEFLASSKPEAQATVVAPKMTRRQQILKLRDEPFVKKVMDAFDADVTDFNHSARK